MNKLISKDNLIFVFLTLVGAGTILAYIFLVPKDNFDHLPVDSRNFYQFDLESSEKEPYKESFVGHWTLLEIGYMTCPDVCPASLAYLAREYDTWRAKLAGVKVAFLSVDPERDKLDSLTRYVRHFNPGFVALRAEEPELKKFVRKLGGYYSYDDSESKAGYLVTHSAHFFLIDPRGKLVASILEPQIKGKLTQIMSKKMEGI